MLKKMGVLMVVFMVSVAFIGIALAEGEGNARKGKYLFRKNCRTCHMEGGEGKELSPVSKTQGEWQKVFDATDQLACAAEWEGLSESDRKDIYAYLWGHAFDSPSPAKCK